MKIDGSRLAEFLRERGLIAGNEQVSLKSLAGEPSNPTYVLTAGA